MQFKYHALSTNQVAGQPASTRTHRLTFIEPGDEGALGPGGNQVNLTLTAAEAAAYTLGEVYDLQVGV